MNAELLVATPDGDKPVSPEQLALPLDGCPSGTTYGDYFQALESWLLADNARPLMEAAGRLTGRALGPGDLAGLRLRSEKHGALYHPASAELALGNGGRVRLAVLAATSDPGREALQREFRILEGLHRLYGLPHLPRPLLLGQRDNMVLALAEWFEDFHEFHAGPDGSLLLWDNERGHHPLSMDQARQVFFQAGRILAGYFDPDSGARIHPWHHAAGDFTAKASGGRVQVRLTTARGWSAPEPTAPDPLTRFFLFFLETTLHMRLDRVHGTQEPIWLGPWSAAAAGAGMVRALGDGLSPDLSPGRFLDLAASFSAQELAIPLEGVAQACAGSDRELALAHLEEHARELASSLKG